MSGDNLTQFFHGFLEKQPLFLNKKVLQANYTPDMIPHRNEQINYIAGILAPVLRLEKPSNIFLYGKTGTGKTVVSKYVTSQILKVANEKKLPIQIAYLNCKLKRVADTEYRIITQMAKEFGLEILRVAGEVAERQNKTIISIEDIDEAEGKIERDKILEVVHTQPKQFQL